MNPRGLETSCDNWLAGSSRIRIATNGSPSIELTLKAGSVVWRCGSEKTFDVLYDRSEAVQMLTGVRNPETRL